MNTILPQYMIPAGYIWLDALPLNSNGKVDRAKLPTEEQSLSVMRTSYVAPRNTLEERLVSLWQDILGKHPIGVTDNFFDLGGESLRAVRLAIEIEKTLHTKITVPLIFQAQTVEALGRVIRREREESNSSWLVPIQTQGSNPPLFCVLFGNTYRLYMKNFPEQPFYMLGLLNNEDINGHISPGRHGTLVASDRFKKVRSARPQLFLRAKRTGTT